MKTYLKSILAIIAILLCACEKDPTFEFQSIDDNATKVSNITATSADVTFSIIIAQSGRYSIVNHNYNYADYVEIYYSTSSNPFQGLAEYKYVYSAGTYTLQLKELEPGTTYYYAAKLGDQKGEVRSFTTLAATGKENGHEWVDLGLSVKWATCNVGASKPEEYGGYFAWGETSPKSVYDWSTYKYMQSGKSSWAYITRYTIPDGQKSGIWYNGDTFVGDNKTTLDLADDAARQNWGGNWRMPTEAELDELRNNCTWTWTTKNGTKGYLVKSKMNGMSIFLPASGKRYNSSLNDVGSDVCCWSSSLYENYSDLAYYLIDVARSTRYRYYGLSVRSVCQ